MGGSKILWRVPSLNNHSLDPRAVIVLDLVPRASAQQSDEARLLNYWNISFQARVMAVLKMDWQQLWEKPQFWDKFEGCPLWTAITQVLNAIFQKFKSLAPNAWYAPALETESRSIGPLAVQRWKPSDNFFQILDFCLDFLYPCSNTQTNSPSPRHTIQVNCSPRIQIMVMERGYPSKDFWSIHVQMLITQAWNRVSWEFKNL